MNNQEALQFIRKYFAELFVKRNLDALDVYLDEDYFDDDIGDPSIDHRKNSREYLARWFKEKPTINVEVKDAMAEENVITAFLHWYTLEGNAKRSIYKGVAIFVLKNNKILKRHTFFYFREPSA